MAKINEKKKKRQMLLRMRRRGNPYPLLVAVQTGAATVESSVEIPPKLEIDLPFDPAISFLGLYLKGSIPYYFILLFNNFFLFRRQKNMKVKTVVFPFFFYVFTNFFQVNTACHVPLSALLLPARCFQTAGAFHCYFV